MSIPQALLRIALITVILAGMVVGAIWLGVNLLDRALDVPKAGPYCSVFDDQDCTGLGAAYISQVTGVSIPSGSVIVDAEQQSNSLTDTWTLVAKIALPHDQILGGSPLYSEVTISYPGTDSQGRAIAIINMLVNSKSGPEPG